MISFYILSVNILDVYLTPGEYRKIFHLNNYFNFRLMGYIKPLPTSARLIFQIFASWLVIATDIYVNDLEISWDLEIFILRFGIPYHFYGRSL